MKKALIIAIVVVVALMVVLTVTAAPTAVGAEKCKMCHKVQYDSWVASKHASATPKVECETCHGPGSDYMKMSVMKDVAAAKAAGLIIPTKADCAKCHGKGKVPAITDDMFAKVHAHKAK
jgi:DnaJ-class molecular chaperone